MERLIYLVLSSSATGEYRVMAICDTVGEALAQRKELMERYVEDVRIIEVKEVGVGI